MEIHLKMKLKNKFESKSQTQTQNENATLSEGSKSNSQKKTKFELPASVMQLGDYTIAILLFSLSLLILFVYVVPSFNRFKTKSEEIRLAEDKLQKVTAHAEYLKRLSAIKDQIEENVEYAENAMPNEDNVAQMSNQLVRIALENNVDIKSLSYGGSSIDATDSLGKVKSQMAVTGSYQDIFNFIKSLENSRRLFTVDSIRIGISQDNGTYDVGMTVTGYYSPSSQESYNPENYTQPQIPANITNRLKSMRYYDPGVITNEIGKRDPFSSGFESNGIPNTNQNNVQGETRQESSGFN